MKANSSRGGASGATGDDALRSRATAVNAVARTVGQRRRGWDWRADPWKLQKLKIAAVAAVRGARGPFGHLIEDYFEFGSDGCSNWRCSAEISG